MFKYSFTEPLIEEPRTHIIQNEQIVLLSNTNTGGALFILEWNHMQERFPGGIELTRHKSYASKKLKRNYYYFFLIRFSLGNTHFAGLAPSAGPNGKGHLA